MDPSHTIWYGLIINIIELFRNRVFSPSFRKDFDQRLLHYEWPRGVPRLSFNIGHSKLKRWSMSIYKQIALILPALFWKLIDDMDFELILDIMQIVEFYAAPTYSLKRAKEVSDHAFVTVQNIVKRFPFDESSTANVKIPTMHMVLEYLAHDVPNFGHRASDCLTEEHKHQTVRV